MSLSQLPLTATELARGASLPPCQGMSMSFMPTPPPPDAAPPVPPAAGSLPRPSALISPSRDLIDLTFPSPPSSPPSGPPPPSAFPPYAPEAPPPPSTSVPGLWRSLLARTAHLVTHVRDGTHE
eukprot:2868425-Pleurochrysis_carterae.AAC.1